MVQPEGRGAAQHGHATPANGGDDVAEPCIPTRMGDGSMVEKTRSELRADIEAGTAEGARRAKCPPLGADELDHLLDIYYRSVGRNSGLLLNVPPNDKGLFCELDIRRLKEWRAALDETFATDFAAGQPAVASNVRGGDEAFGPARALDGDIDTYWATDDDVRTASLEVDLGAPATFNVSRVQEYIPLGERVRGYTIEAWQDGAWKEIVKGTTIGHKKLERFPEVTTPKVRLTITDARACPMIAGFGLHYAPRHGLGQGEE